MPINYEETLARRADGIRHVYSERDTMLYALSVGFGRHPTDLEELSFVFEGPGLLTLPTMAAVLIRKSALSGLDINWNLLLHGEQRLKVHKPLPASGEVVCESYITRVVDKGEGRGALVYGESEVRLAATGDLLVTCGNTVIARGDGGFGGPPVAPLPIHPIPDRAPDHQHITHTRGDQALLYRLNGDYNPVHADPSLAPKIGFPKPILHGLCTYAIAYRAVLATVCGFKTHLIREFDARFSSPVFPGDTVITEIWVDGGLASFRTRVVDRDVTALNNGRCVLNFNDAADA